MNKLRRLNTICATLIVLATIVGCAETSRVGATGKGKIRGINSIVTSPELSFKIEEKPIGNPNFRQVAGFAPYDDLSYTFNFDVLLPGASDATRLASQFIDVIAGTEYTIVIGGTIAAPTIMMWEELERVFADGATTTEVDFVHLSPTLGEVDVYFNPVGSAPMLGEAVGTLNYGDRIPHQEYPDGSREFIVTPKDDPGNYLYQSPAIAASIGVRVTYAIFDPDPTITATVAVNQIAESGGSVNIPDSRFRPEFRLLHAAFGTDNVDAYLNNDFGTIVVPNIGFGELSAYNEIDSIAMPLTLTDVGNSGAPVHESEIAIGGNSRHTIFFAGEPGTLSLLDYRDDGRPLETSPQVRIANVHVNAASIDVYMQPPGTVIDNTTPVQFRGLPSLLSTGFMTPEAGIYEITITELGNLAPIAPPLTIDIANSDIVDIAILNTVDPAVAELFIISSTVP